MALPARATAWLMQKSAPFTVRYGRDLVFSGADLPKPRTIRIPTRHGRVRCLVHDGTGATYVHLHGGAFIMRYPQMDDFFCRFIAAELGVSVLNVDYDAAPQVRYPVAQEQAADVVSWVSTYGIGDGVGPVAVGGFSAGGNLAASACLQLRDAGDQLPVAQLLGVPALDMASAYDDKAPDGHRGMIGRELTELVRAGYFPDPIRRAEAYASPSNATDLTGLPPAIVITGERDLLRVEGDAYADRLSDAGVSVVHRTIPGADHYFLDGDRTRARETMDLIADELFLRLRGRARRTTTT